MRKTVSVLALVLALCGMTAEARADVISIRSDSWCPYNCAPDSKKPGYGIEIAKAIFEKAGHSIDYQLMNWTRSIDRGLKGEHTAIIGARREEAQGYVLPKECVGKQGNVFAVSKDSTFSYSGTASLSGKVLGIIQSYSYNEALDEYIKKNAANPQAIDAATGDDALERNLSKLASGRLDAVVDDKAVLTYKVNEMGFSDKLKVVSSGDEASEVFLAFSPKNPKAKDYADLFDKGMEELRSSGKLAEILGRYGLSDWK